jgi:hypothetical protein
MTPTFNLVWAEFWPEALARGWNDDMKQGGLYLLTCKHRELAGLYHLPVAYAAEDLGWPTERALEALDRLIVDDFIAYDERARVVWIRKAIKRQPPTSANHIRGAINAIKKVPETSLLVDLFAMAETHAEGFAKALRDEFPTLSEGMSNVGIRVPTTLSVNEYGDRYGYEDRYEDKEGSNVSGFHRPLGERKVVVIERATTSEDAA